MRAMRAEEIMFKILVADDDGNTRLLFETVQAVHSTSV